MTKLRQLAEKRGSIMSFIPTPPEKFFGSAARDEDNLGVQAISYCEDTLNEWVRGWEFWMRKDNSQQADCRFLDWDEISQVKRLLEKQSDESVKSGFQYHSLEGVIFYKFRDAQQVAFSTPGVGMGKPIGGRKVVEEIFAFMKSSAELWER